MMNRLNINRGAVPVGEFSSEPFDVEPFIAERLLFSHLVR
jgi:hypothetical protein